MLAPEDGGFSEVENLIAERLDKTVEWNRETEDDGAIDQAVDDLLKNKLTADEAVQVALLNNRRLMAMYEELGLTRAGLIQAGLLHNPVFTGLVKTHNDAEVIELMVAQDFLSILTVPLRRARAKADLRMAINRVEASVIDMAAKTRRAYYEYQAAKMELELFRTVLDSNDAGYEAARRLHSTGNITDLTLYSERAFFEQARLSVSAAETALVSRKEALNRLMGLYGPYTDWESVDDFPSVPEVLANGEDLERKAIEASLQLKEMRWKIERNGQSLGLARLKSVIPELGVEGEAEREPDGTWFVGPVLEYALPIFDWGQGSRRRATAELRRTWRNYTATSIEVRSAVRAAYHQAITAQQRALYYRDVMVPLSERVTNETQLQYNAMQTGVFTLLGARQNDILVQRQYVQSMLDYMDSRIRLEQILDGGSPDISAGAMMPAAGGMERGGGGH